MDFIKKTFIRYKEIVSYVIFGGLTTLISIGTFWLFAHLLGQNELISNVFAWVVAVTFAFFTNKFFVFESKDKEAKTVLQEGASFYVSRLGTLGLEELLLFVFVTSLRFNDMAIKVIANIIVIILNYVLSKILVFRKKK